jgi:hypothetical protein
MVLAMFDVQCSWVSLEADSIAQPVCIDVSGPNTSSNARHLPSNFGRVTHLIELAQMLIELEAHRNCSASILIIALRRDACQMGSATRSSI